MRWGGNGRGAYARAMVTAVDPLVSVADFLADREAVVLDCRPEEAAYRAGHLAGAYHVSLDRDLLAVPTDPARGGRHPLPDLATFAATLGRLGITPERRVVAYDDQNGANAAARCWWMLRAVGHRAVRVLDGGLAAARAADFPFTTEVPPPAAAPPYPVTAWSLPMADVEAVDRARKAADQRVVDVRAAFRFRGEREPIDPIAGHIPGAWNVPLTDNLRPDGTFREARELRALYEPVLAGLSPGRLVVHCGSGVTACHTLLALERAGLPGAQLYVGSWSEWCRNPERPRAPA